MLGHVPRLSSINPNVPLELEHIIARAMHIDPRERYQSAFELVVALEDFAAEYRCSTSALTLSGWLRNVCGEPEAIMLTPGAAWRTQTTLLEDHVKIFEAPKPIEGKPPRRGLRRAAIAACVVVTGAGASVGITRLTSESAPVGATATAQPSVEPDAAAAVPQPPDLPATEHAPTTPWLGP